jgi:hypothetical protein
VVHTLDLGSACSISRIFHPVSSKMGVSIFEIFRCFSFLQASRDFVPVLNNPVRVDIFLTSSLPAGALRFRGSAVLLVLLCTLFTEQNLESLLHHVLFYRDLVDL